MADRSQQPPSVAPADETLLLLEYLRGRDTICPLCRYNLRDLTVPRCPECGRELRIAVGLVEQNYRPYITLMVFLLLPGGVGAILTLGVVVSGLALYTDPPARLVACIVGFQVSMIPAAAAVFLRRRFLRMKPRAQRTLAASAVMLCVILYAAYAMSVG